MATSQPSVSSRGIPKALFIEDVEDFISKQASADEALKKMQENYSKFKLMEMSLSKSKTALKSKIPEIKNTLVIVQHLQSKKGSSETVNTQFELSDNVYATASITPSVVCLWLGANVMVEYSFEEAVDLLTKNLESAEKNLKGLDEDIGFLKEQITTTEVNIARVYNHDVKQRRKKRDTAEQ
ncbi:prefoldin subunit 3-like isoform 1 [Planoprotostelium fungivorum]|uniref:Prefoldin subunit 3 n=1 Tax=Planoprotostelium fungivorum TaxID=1890364 RepID=A0A2P6NQG0_9EUKA|nr:prefoldin subunit 3-like isoform 1 [Planoprotostelium fungivorum]